MDHYPYHTCYYFSRCRNWYWWIFIDEILPGIGKKVCMSYSGQYQTITLFQAGIYTSKDFGISWSQPISNSLRWQTCSMSGDGIYQTAAAYLERIYTSNPPKPFIPK